MSWEKTITFLTVRVSAIGIIILITSCSEVSMSAKFQIISPEATRNLVRNPSVEENITDWTAQGAVVTRSTARARFGRFSVQVVTDGVGLFEGVNVRSFPDTSGTTYAASTYVRGAGRIRLRFRDNTNGDEAVSDTVNLTDDRWIRITDIIGRTGGAVSNDLRIHIETPDTQAITFYVDSAQIEENPYSTTYIDGDQKGGRWNILVHASESSRSTEERSGGRLVDLDEEELGLYITVAGGIGMPPLRHNVQGRALLPGVEFQSTKILPRVIMLTFWIKERDACPGALRRLHEVREALIDLIKPDRVAPTQPFVLRYLGGTVPINIECFYEAGLGFDGDLRNQFFNSFVVRFLSTDPFWEEDDQDLAELDFSQILNNADFLQARVEELWTLPYDVVADNGVFDIVEAPNGNIYLGGPLNNIDGVLVRRITRYDGVNYNPLTAGIGVDAQVREIAVAPDGTVYFGGDFRNDGAGAIVLERIARYDPVADTFTALGAGLNNAVLANAIAIHPVTGDVYVGGQFDDVQGGVGNTLSRIARWDVNNLTWNPVGAGGAGPGLNGNVLSLVFSPDGSTLYAGGFFSEEGTGAAAYPGTLGGIIQYDIATDTGSSMGVSGFLPTRGPVALRVGPDGTIYGGGSFVTVDGITVNNVAQWNGVQWEAMGQGTNDTVDDMAVDLNGNVIAVGEFTEADGREPARGFALWIGSTWVHGDALFPATPPPAELFTIMVARSGDLWAGSVDTGSMVAAGLTTVENTGTADALPVFVMTGPGTLVWLENITVGTRLYLDMELQDGETVTIDLRAGKRTVISDWSGNRIRDVLPNSDFSTWKLRPGNNDILAFIQDEGANTTLSMSWIPTHHSADGTVR